jgi:hypothetical protein
MRLFAVLVSTSLFLSAVSPFAEAQEAAPQQTATAAAPKDLASAVPGVPADTTPKTTGAVAAKPESSGTTTATPTESDAAANRASNKFFQPVPAGVVLKAAKTKAKKEKPPKQIPLTVEHGVLTVDGWAGKADLNYQIADFKYFYLWSPGVGTVVVSTQIFPGSKYQAAAFDGGTLTVAANGHQLQLTSDRRMLGKKPEGAYVRVDPDAEAPSRYPQVGYGESFKAPYSWPGSLADTHPNPNAPPLPEALKPTLQTTKMCAPASEGKEDCKVVAVPMSTGKKS